MNGTEQSFFENTFKSGLILRAQAMSYLENSNWLQPELGAAENETLVRRVSLWFDGGGNPPTDPYVITVFEINNFSERSSVFVVREASWKNWGGIFGARIDEGVRKYNRPVYVEPMIMLRDARISASDFADWLAKAPSFELSATREFPGCLAEDCSICGFDVFGPGIHKAVISLCWQLEPPSSWQPFWHWYREFHKYLRSLLPPEAKQSRVRYNV